MIALDVLRSVKSGVWEGGGSELLQVDGIGLSRMDRLVRAGVSTIKQLANIDFSRIERLLTRNPPFGHRVLQSIVGFPRLACQLEALGTYPLSSEQDDSSRTLQICRFVLSYENEQTPHWKKNALWATLVVKGDGGDGSLLWF